MAPFDELAASEGALNSPRAGERVFRLDLTRLLLPLSQRSQPRRPVAQRKLSFAPRSRTGASLLPGTHPSDTSSRPRPPVRDRRRAFAQPPTIRQSRFRGNDFPGFHPGSARRIRPAVVSRGKRRSAELNLAYQPKATLTFSITPATAVSDCGQLVWKLCA